MMVHFRHDLIGVFLNLDFFWLILMYEPCKFLMCYALTLTYVMFLLCFLIVNIYSGACNVVIHSIPLCLKDICLVFCFLLPSI